MRTPKEIYRDIKDIGRQIVEIFDLGDKDSKTDRDLILALKKQELEFWLELLSSTILDGKQEGWVIGCISFATAEKADRVGDMHYVENDISITLADGVTVDVDTENDKAVVRAKESDRAKIAELFSVPPSMLD